MTKLLDYFSHILSIFTYIYTYTFNIKNIIVSVCIEAEIRESPLVAPNDNTEPLQRRLFSKS